jgi:GGDEF domain-containing protein
MLTAVVAACAVLVGCGAMLVWLQRARRHADARLEQLLHQVDGHLAAMSQSVARAVDAGAESRAQRLPALTLDFDELVHSLVAETAVRTGADAVVLRVEGPGGRPIVASVGAGVETETLDRSFGPPAEAPFDTAAIEWTYSPVGEPGDTRFQSALVTPLGPGAGTRGVVVAYALAAGAFRAGHAAAVRELLRDATVALSNARRFAEVEARVNVDRATGIPNRRGYELELEREVARAERSGRPLSVIVVGVGGGETDVRASSSVGEIARMVSRLTRRGDIPCRRGERELAILLPGTEEGGATVLTRRLREAVATTISHGTSTVAVGLVERLPAETSYALDARLDETLGHRRETKVRTLDEARNASTAVAATVRSTLATGAERARPQGPDILRQDTLDALARELHDARSFGRSLAVAVVDVEGLDSVSERLGREMADTLLSDLAGRLDRSVSSGSVHRLGARVFALVLPGSGVDEAEALVDALQSSLDPPHDETGLVLSAGITEVAEEDDEEASLGRAEHAVWQATQAGPGTIVVAVPNRRPIPRR